MIYKYVHDLHIKTEVVGLFNFEDHKQTSDKIFISYV
jgi:hypothetical protein